MKRILAAVLLISALVIILITLNELFSLSSFVPTEKDYKFIEEAKNTDEIVALLSEAKHDGYILEKKELIISVIMLCSFSLLTSIILVVCLWKRRNDEA